MTTPETNPRNSALKVLVPVFVIVAVAVGGLLLVKSQVKPHDPLDGAIEVKAGAILPDFTLQAWNGKPVRASELGKKVLMVNFWATWCEACMVEMPSIVKLRESYKDRGFEVIAINVDDNPDAVLPRAIKQFAIPFVVYLDLDQALAELFDVHAIPLTVIMDGNRKILMIESGERNWNGTDIRSLLERWLAS